MSIAPPANTSDVALSPSFHAVNDSLKRFSLTCFHDPVRVEEYVDLFSLRALCKALEADRAASKNSVLEKSVSAFEEKPFEPEYDDLCRLHWIALSRKVINALEFGSGYSTVILTDAMRILDGHFGEWARKSIRSDNPFHVYAVEEEQHFLEITRSRLGSRLQAFATISHSSVDVLIHDNRIASVYSKLPNISPDFIYLDGPSQFATTQEINGFSFNSKARMPMSADILRVEFFLEPGTLILVDGRTANARFLKSYLRRNWIHLHDTIGDIHYFELQEEPLGPFNKLKLEFCLNGNWLIA
ncbi:hypothetical protein NNRS527_00366 [Nitrosospira sp. NRS527]|nr:hypothetical protein NNRS527_00366 [Nitrosospira sp. NRS527]